MTARDLERLLTAQGAGKAKIEAITRQLRDSGRLRTAGRGNYAPTIGPEDAALMLIALAGSTKGNEADIRVGKLQGIVRKTGNRSKRTLLETLTLLLSEPSKLKDVAAVRVARTQRRAGVHFIDGRVEEFSSPKSGKCTDRFQVEGILPRPLLQLVASALLDECPSAPDAVGEQR